MDTISEATWNAGAAKVALLEERLARINEKAAQLRDEIGGGSALAELRARVHNLVELSREHLGQ
jgi:hypothetical protein